MDVSLAAERPRLIQLSEAFSVVSHTAALGKPAVPRTVGPKAGLAHVAGAAPSLVAAAGLSAAAGLNGAPPLTRHRYFSAAELRGATEALQEDDGPPLTRKALGLSDRLAALVAQQAPPPRDRSRLPPRRPQLRLPQPLPPPPCPLLPTR